MSINKLYTSLQTVTFKLYLQQCDLIFHYVYTLNCQRESENKQAETMACSNFAANTLELCKQDNTTITYAVIEHCAANVLEKSIEIRTIIC